MKLLATKLGSFMVVSALLGTGLSFALGGSVPVSDSLLAQVKAPAKAKAAAQTAAPKTKAYQKTTAVSILKEPGSFLNKDIEFEGTFSSFSSLGLDYKKAFRDSKDYVGLLILRPDVTHHKIPLSEMKLLFPRKKSETVMHLESGDVIAIKGNVFSTVLNDPWIDVDEIQVIKKLNPEPTAETTPCLDDC